jgi:hypothetical protein
MRERERFFASGIKQENVYEGFLDSTDRIIRYSTRLEKFQGNHEFATGPLHCNS